MVRIANRAMDKNMDYETLYYSDDMYGNEKETENVWDYVIECREMGTTAFDKKYEHLFKD